MRKDFFGVTIRQIKRNLQCARCKKEKCPLRYKHGVRVEGIRITCNEVWEERMNKILKEKKIKKTF